MPRFGAVWNNTNDDHWKPAGLVRADWWSVDVGQNIEYLAQVHDHDPNVAARGGPLVLNEPEEIAFRMGAI